MDLIKKHIDTIIILTAFASALLWINGKFNDLEKEIYLVKTEVAILKTVMVMKNIMPSELVKKEDPMYNAKNP
jgi:hypothetical protein